MNFFDVDDPMIRSKQKNNVFENRSYDPERGGQIKPKKDSIEKSIQIQNKNPSGIASYGIGGFSRAIPTEPNYWIVLESIEGKWLFKIPLKVKEQDSNMVFESMLVDQAGILKDPFSAYRAVLYLKRFNERNLPFLTFDVKLLAQSNKPQNIKSDVDSLINSDVLMTDDDKNSTQEKEKENSKNDITVLNSSKYIQKENSEVVIDVSEFKFSIPKSKIPSSSQ
eukprot:NODE_1639_length_785_cov_14.772036_g1590_i0.p1 GENE.NODE_1639_length_785_cov_14.772036_g1590_i0~~NODE_1639_length_785_cov_14.772036_g1590_i0.p1  ORF type:complete len:223 (-),score=30.86 NODE_1639_length_785_cov_14.772036_g1590_i0:43-711(-)